MSSTALEVRPGALDPSEIKALELTTARLLSVGGPARLVGPDGETVDLPEEIFEVVLAVIEQLKQGNGITVAPLHAELTTAEAADLLNVSRPFLIKQLEGGALPYRMVGTHRRVHLGDVLAYRDQLDQQAEHALAEMTQDAEERGLYNDK
jgi:excisionase family DNA binding protein